MNSETLGEHLRNLLTPYKTLLNLIDDVVNDKMDLKILQKIKCNNLDELIDFSKSDIMESNFWRK